jgi:hypothetical protein
MRRLRTFVVAALLALGAGAGSAATGASVAAVGDDPLQAADCRRALASLQARETAADAAARANAASGAHDQAAPSVELQAARRLAARNCLASHADPPTPPLRSIQAPIVVAPVAPAAAPRPPATVARLPPPVPTPAERPYAVTACDPGGCWANDGSRLNRIGPNLWGKRGICTLHGSLLQCP